MAITIITGTSGVGKTTLANAIRNNQISKGHGALLIDEGADTKDLRPHVEKLLLGQVLPEKAPDGGWFGPGMKWKSSITVVLVGGQASQTLSRIESLVPGFTAKFGPVREISINLKSTAAVRSTAVK